MSSDMVMKALWQPTIDVVTAGQVLGIGRDAARRAAKAGEIPIIRVAGRSRVPCAKLRAMLGLPEQPPSSSVPIIQDEAA